MARRSKDDYCWMSFAGCSQASTVISCVRRSRWSRGVDGGRGQPEVGAQLGEVAHRRGWTHRNGYRPAAVGGPGSGRSSC